MSRPFFRVTRRLRGILESIETRRLEFWMNRIESKLDSLERRRRDLESHTHLLILRRADLKSEMHTLPANVIAFPDRKRLALTSSPLGHAVR